MKVTNVRSTVKWMLLVAVAGVLAGVSGVTTAQIIRPPLYTGYTLTDLGVNASAGWSFAYAINNAGQAVGDMTKWSGENHAFRTQANQQINPFGSDDLGVLYGDYRSYAYSINNSGVAVGNSVHNFNYIQTRAIRSNSPGAVLEDLHTASTSNFPTGMTHSFARSINDYGWITGYYMDKYNHSHSMISFGPAWTQPIDASWYGNPYQSATFDINNNSQLVGWRTPYSNSFQRAFMFDAAGGVMRMIDIGVLPGGLTSTASAINDYAQVVGESQNATTVHAFIFKDANNNGIADAGELKDLDTVNSAQSGAKGINNNGVAVGYFAGDSSIIYGTSRAALFSNGTVTDLNTQVRNGTGPWTLRVATAINDNGQIVGFMEDNNTDNQARVRHAFRLDPYVPG